jgi:5-methylcytosine-specific restriction endonuclease McrA
MAQCSEKVFRSCDQHGGRLNAHHVWPFQRFPEWRFEVWNLVTLCKRCHDAFHKQAGGHVRVAIGPFFSKTYEVREQPAEYAYGLAA